MIFTVYQTSGHYNERYTIEINTIQELLEFCKKNGKSEVIVNEEEMSLEIYDDWRE